MDEQARISKYKSSWKQGDKMTGYIAMPKLRFENSTANSMYASAINGKTTFSGPSGEMFYSKRNK